MHAPPFYCPTLQSQLRFISRLGLLRSRCAIGGERECLRPGGVGAGAPDWGGRPGVRPHAACRSPGPSKHRPGVPPAPFIPFRRRSAAAQARLSGCMQGERSQVQHSLCGVQHQAQAQVPAHGLRLACIALGRLPAPGGAGRLERARSRTLPPPAPHPHATLAANQSSAAGRQPAHFERKKEI